MANGFLLRSLPFVVVGHSAEDIGTDADNVTNDFMGMIARSPAPGTAMYVRCDFGAAHFVDTVAVLNVFGASVGGSVSATIGNDATFSSYVEHLDITPEAAWIPSSNNFQQALGFFATATPCRYLLVQANVPTTFKPQMSRILLGKRYQPERNFSFGMARGVRDLGENEFAPRGGRLRRRAKKLRTLGLSWSFLTQAEAEGFALPLLEEVGNTDDVLACINPDADPERTRRLYYGPLEGNLGMSWRVANAWEKKLQIASVI